MRVNACRAYLVFGLLVWVGAVAFSLLGCSCTDSVSPTAETAAPTNHTNATAAATCSSPVAELGSSWCVALSLTIATAICLSAPPIFLSIRYYGPYRCVLSIFRAAILAATTALLLIYPVKGESPPPKSGADGIPLGGALVAATLVIAVFFVLSGYGFYKNEALGVSLELATGYVVLSGAAAVVTSYHVHIAMGFGVFIDLAVALAFSLQVYMGDGGVAHRTAFSFCAPLLLGGSCALALESANLGLPEAVGAVIGLGAGFVLTIPISRAYERYGFGGLVWAFGICAFQEVVVVVSIAAGVHLHWTAGMSAYMAIEVCALVSQYIWRIRGSCFALISVSQTLTLSMGVFWLMRAAYALSWALSLTIAAGFALVDMGGVGVGFRLDAARGALRASYAVLLLGLVCLVPLTDILVLGWSPLPSLLFGVGNGALLTYSLAHALAIDDGSGILFGSGIEWLGAVLASLSEGYGVGVLLYATSSASLAAVHVGASTTGALMLLVPGVATTLTPEQRIMRNDFSPTLFGVKLALLLQLLTLTTTLLLFYTASTPLLTAVCLGAASAAALVSVFAAAICRYGYSLVLVYFGLLAGAVASLGAVFWGGAAWRPPMVVGTMAIPGVLLAIGFARPLSIMRAEFREDAKVGRKAGKLARVVGMFAGVAEGDGGDERNDEVDLGRGSRYSGEGAGRRDGRDTSPSLRRGTLPRFAELAHNGVPELAAELEWCLADGKRPTLPFSRHTFVARGDHLFLFTPQREHIPSDRALGAMPLASCRCVAHPSLHIAPMPTFEHMLFIHLHEPWRGRKNFYLKFGSQAKMRLWCAEIERRASAKPSAVRASAARAASEIDPTLAGATETRAVVSEVVTDPVLVRQRRVDHYMERKNTEALQRHGILSAGTPRSDEYSDEAHTGWAVQEATACARRGGASQAQRAVVVFGSYVVSDEGEWRGGV